MSMTTSPATVLWTGDGLGQSSGGNSTIFLLYWLVYAYPSQFYSPTFKLSGRNATVLLFYWLYAYPSQFYSPTLQKSLEVIRWESLPFCCCTGTHIPLSTRLSSMTNVFSSRTVETPSLCHTHIPLSSLVRYFLQDNRLLETTGSTPLLLWWYTFLSTLRSYKTRVVDSFRWELHPFHCCTGTQTSLSPYSPTWQIEFWTVIRWELTCLFSHWYTHIPLSTFLHDNSFGHSSGGNITPFVVLVYTYPSSTLVLYRTRVLKSGGNPTPLLVCWNTHTPPTLLSYKSFAQSGENSTFLLLLYTHTHLNFTLLHRFWTVIWYALHPFVVIHTYLSLLSYPSSGVIRLEGTSPLCHRVRAVVHPEQRTACYSNTTQLWTVPTLSHRNCTPFVSASVSLTVC